jgi:hypothetical protein
MKSTDGNIITQTVLLPKSNKITENYKLYEVNKEEELRLDISPKEEIKIIVTQ